MARLTHIRGVDCDVARVCAPLTRRGAIFPGLCMSTSMAQTNAVPVDCNSVIHDDDDDDEAP
eukprot:7389849-Pyramimonas_sp.AAC.1